MGWNDIGHVIVCFTTKNATQGCFGDYRAYKKRSLGSNKASKLRYRSFIGKNLPYTNYNIKQAILQVVRAGTSDKCRT
jgi:hypothetical protein